MYEITINMYPNSGYMCDCMFEKATTKKELREKVANWKQNVIAYRITTRENEEVIEILSVDIHHRRWHKQKGIEYVR